MSLSTSKPVMRSSSLNIMALELVRNPKPSLPAMRDGMVKSLSTPSSMKPIIFFGASRKSSAWRVGGVSSTSRSYLPDSCSSYSFSIAMNSWEPASAVEICW